MNNFVCVYNESKSLLKLFKVTRQLQKTIYVMVQQTSSKKNYKFFSASRRHSALSICNIVT